MNHKEIEIELILRCILLRYGWDFTNYKKASIQRSLQRIISKNNLDNLSNLIPKILYDANFFEELLCDITIPVSEMFRDPKVFTAIRTHVFPILKTHSFIKIWHAGCASGEEIYSLAILLHEANLLEKARIYATDINLRALQRAKEGIFPANKMDEYSENYLQAGGKANLYDYFQTKYDSMIISSLLKKNISFFIHNLVLDQSFGEMNLIMCRNVLIYFNKTLQFRVINLFEDSLIYGGFLCLGTKEKIATEEAKNIYAWLQKEQIYRKGVLSQEKDL